MDQRRYVKLLRKDLTHNGFTYTPNALNVDTNPFCGEGACQKGGLYFFSQKQLRTCLKYVNISEVHYICDVTLPDDARVYHEEGKSKADRLILGPLREAWADPTFCMAVVQQCGWVLRYVQKQTPEICLAAVQQDGAALPYVQEQTPEICLAAVQQNGLVLHYVREQTREIRLAAVRENPLALVEYMRKQTLDLCPAAVQRQQSEMCLKAVQDDSMGLQFVREQTPALCMAAVQQTGFELR